MIILPKQYHPDFRVSNVKPRGTIEIDDTHQFMPDGAFIPQLGQGNQLHDLVTGESIDLPADVTWTKDGIRTSTAFDFPSRLRNVGTGEMTVLMKVTKHTSASSDLILSLGSVASGGWYFRVESNTNKTLRYFKDNSSGDVINTSANNSYAVDDPFTVGISYFGGLGPVDVVIDGVHKQALQVGGSAKSVPNSPYVFNSSARDMTLEWVYFWTRPVSVAFLQELTRDPFQLLKPVMPPVYFTPTGGIPDIDPAFIPMGIGPSSSPTKLLLLGMSPNPVAAGEAPQLALTGVG
jgi:hypothetical protein